MWGDYSRKPASNSKNTFEKDDDTKKFMQDLIKTSSNSVINDNAERSKIIWLVTSKIIDKYRSYPQEFDECLKQYLNDHNKYFRDNKSKLSSLPFLFWIYYFYTFA